MCFLKRTQRLALKRRDLGAAESARLTADLGGPGGGAPNKKPSSMLAIVFCWRVGSAERMSTMGCESFQEVKKNERETETSRVGRDETRAEREAAAADKYRVGRLLRAQ
jgi:hypothetical protein